MADHCTQQNSYITVQIYTNLTLKAGFIYKQGKQLIPKAWSGIRDSTDGSTWQGHTVDSLHNRGAKGQGPQAK